MVGDNEAALKSLHNYHQVIQSLFNPPLTGSFMQVWKQYGFTPEFYNVAQGGVAAQRRAVSRQRSKGGSKAPSGQSGIVGS